MIRESAAMGDEEVYETRMKDGTVYTTTLSNHCLSTTISR